MAAFYYRASDNKTIYGKGISKKFEISSGGDKSITHRAMILSAMAAGTSKIKNPSLAGDCLTTLAALEKLGVKIEFSAADKTLKIKSPGIENFIEPDGFIDCENSGSGARFLMGALAGIDGKSFFLAGDASLAKRPMKRVSAPLEKMGANIILRSGGNLPASIKGSKLKAIKFDNAAGSAQVKTALMMAAISARGTTVITERYETRNHTELMFPNFALEAELAETRDGHIKISVPGKQTVQPASINIANDISTASFYLGLSALFQTVHGVPFNITAKETLVNETRLGFLTSLAAAGFKVEYARCKTVSNEEKADISVTAGSIKRNIFPVSMDDPEEIISTIDEIPMLALTLALADGTSLISGLSELRVKESDRLSVLSEGLKKMGADISVKNDSLIIRGVKKLHGADLDPKNDHRMTMTFIIAGIVSGCDFSVKNTECVKVSNPAFFEELDKMGFKFEIK